MGVSLSGALTQAILAKELGERITGEDAEEVTLPFSWAPFANPQIITSIRQSSTSIRHLPPHLQEAATASYQKALHAVFMVGIVLTVVVVLAGLGIREVDMDVAEKKTVSDEDDEE